MDQTCELPSVRQIARINEQMIARFGGEYIAHNDNLMHPGTLEALLEDCQGVYYGEERYPSVIDKAAMLGWRIIKGHLFRDGNKRTGLQTCRTVLYLNGYNLPLDEEAEAITLAIAMGEMSLDSFTDWVGRKARTR